MIQCLHLNMCYEYLGVLKATCTWVFHTKKNPKAHRALEFQLH